MHHSMFDQVHWTNGSIVGAPLMQAHQKFMSIKVSLGSGACLGGGAAA